MKKILKEILLTTCCSFSFVLLTFTVVNNPDIAPDINAASVQKIFFISMLVSIMISATLIINYSKQWMFFATSIVIMFIVVFGTGTFLMDFIPLTPSVYAFVSVMMLAVYWFCYFILFAKNQKDADRINKKLEDNLKKGR